VGDDIVDGQLFSFRIFLQLDVALEFVLVDL
jgi:hypothetical protein